MPHVILFVDDEPDVLAILRRTFAADEDYEVLTAPSGVLALETLRARRVDLLVTDQRMPAMTGVELVEEAHRIDPELCAVLLTAYTDPKDIVAAINRGRVWRYLVKPWEKADLRATVRTALEQVDLRRERDRLLAEVERRLEALQAASEVAREVGAAESHARILERVVERLPRIVPCDVAAAIVAAPGAAPDLLIRPVSRLSDAALLAAKEDALAAWRDLAGLPLEESAVAVRVLGPGGGDGPAVEGFASRLILPVEVDGARAGALLVESAAPDAFGEGDARVLDVLVNEVAHSLGVFAARLAGERERLERVVECMADGLLYAVAGAGEVLANPAARRMLGAPLEGSLEVTWLKDVLGFQPFDLARGLAAGPSGRASVGEEVRVAGRTLAAVVSPVPEHDGGLAGVAVALRDVTDQKELAERKEEFLQVVSHELRTPLTSIAGALDLVLGGLAGELGEKQAHFLKMARDSSDKLNHMVDELLDVARLAKGKLRMEPAALMLDELARTTSDRYQAAAAERRLALRVEGPPEPVRIVADGGRLGQVLSNLLTNAVKFTPEGGKIQVRVFRAAALPGLAGLSVWNSGEGIPEDDLERIFEKFEQSRTPTNRRVRGTGLGLAICRGIVEAHGGAIWAESAPGEGARFLAVLPEEPPEGAGERPPVPPGAPSVLVVDQGDVAALACGALRLRGMRCARASDVEGALALARQAPPQVVVWDPLLPPFDRVPLAEILHHDADTRRAALLAFTPPRGRDVAFRGGADDHLGKPAAPEAFAAAVEALALRGRPAGTRVLVVDDDPAIRAICAEVLRNQGLEVSEADTCAEARRLVLERRPHLALLDVQLPDGDGFSLLESLSDERAAEPFAAVFLSARGETADKVRGLRLGADDYLTKPFDARELVARVDAVLRRREAALQASPMTRLPGGCAIDQEVERRLAARASFALSYVDLDHLKAYNDTYGYAKADGVVLQTAGILRDAMVRLGGEGAFLGHVGGDDFVLLTAPERAARVCAEVVAAFDRVIPLYYERADRERGTIDAVDRFGVLRSFPLLSISIATVAAPPGRFDRHADLARAAAELKERAKRVKGSVHLLDAGEGAPP
jgi:signal transduction histidine kinase/DNA-binding response OmpR family regulator